MLGCWMYSKQRSSVLKFFHPRHLGVCNDYAEQGENFRTFPCDRGVTTDLC